MLVLASMLLPVVVPVWGGGGCLHAHVDDSGTVPIPAGAFTMGSSPHDRALALDDGARRGADLREGVARLQAEQAARRVSSKAFSIMAHAVTQGEYAEYVYAMGAAEPWVDATTWSRTPHRRGEDPRSVAWQRGRPRAELMDRPAVLVSQPEASGYCAWWGDRRGGLGTLPSEAEWERAAKGDHRDDPHAPNPFGVQGMRANVAEWTRTYDDDFVVVKGADHAGDVFGARAAARSLRAPVIRHVAIGFRCVLDVPAGR